MASAVADAAQPEADSARDANRKPGECVAFAGVRRSRGSGLRDTCTLHRFDEVAAKKEVEAAGFKLVAETNVLRNSAGTHTLKMFDPAIRGHTERFILRFRKPR